MRKHFAHRYLLPMTALAGCIATTSCMKDVFDPEQTKASYENQFPVKGIDPLMDWKTTQAIDVEVNIGENTGEAYTLGIYDANPLTEGSRAHLLTAATIESGKTFTTRIDYPSALSLLYICRTDAHLRSVVKTAKVDGTSVHASFGVGHATRADEANSVPVIAPRYTKAELSAMIKQAELLRPSTVLTEGGLYKIAPGTTYQNDVKTSGKLSADRPAKVIVEGTWKPGGNISAIADGVELILTGTGTIVLPDANTPDNSALRLNGSTYLIIYPGGKIASQNPGKSYIYLDKNSTDNYNGGIIEAGTLYMVDGAQLYNSGTLNARTVSHGGTLVNQGQADIGDLTNRGGGITLNGCLLKVSGRMTGSLTMGKACAAYIHRYDYAQNQFDARISMGANSMIDIDDYANLDHCSVMGPEGGHALIKINALNGIKQFSHTGGPVYYEVKKENITPDWGNDTFVSRIADTEGVMTLPGQSPVVIPEGECTGEGNMPSEGLQLPNHPIVYTYAYEDNYPLMGDYDFNDVVIDLTTEYIRQAGSNAIGRIRYNITLAAAGATKHPLGVGLRIVGVPKSAIAAVRSTGTDDARFHASLTDGELFAFNPSTLMEDADKDILLPVSGNVHAVFDEGAEGQMINTGFKSKPTYTYQIEVELTDQTRTTPLITKDNLDLFICYPKSQKGKRTEIHLYEFWKYGATSRGDIMQDYLDLAGKSTWGICVPGFGYPREGVCIGSETDTQLSAYPDFVKWAQDRNSHKDWYLRPNSSNVYR